MKNIQGDYKSLRRSENFVISTHGAGISGSQNQPQAIQEQHISVGRTHRETLAHKTAVDTEDKHEAEGHATQRAAENGSSQPGDLLLVVRTGNADAQGQQQVPTQAADGSSLGTHHPSVEESRGNALINHLHNRMHFPTRSHGCLSKKQSSVSNVEPHPFVSPSS